MSIRETFIPRKINRSMITAAFYNPRDIKDKNKTGLNKSLQEHGLVEPLIWNKRTGNLVGGHQRLELIDAANKNQDYELTVAEIDVSSAEEKRINVKLNNPNIQGEFSQEKLKSLLHDPEINLDFKALSFELTDIENLIDLQIDDLLDSDSVKTENKEDDKLEWTPDDGIRAFREDCVFSSSNEWGIPDLKPEMLSAQIPTRVFDGKDYDKPENAVFLYQSAPDKEKAKGGVLAFYTDDYRFERIWFDAVKYVEKLHEYGWGSIIAPDFSLWYEMPQAVKVYNTYRNFWCARYWQEAGFKIIPNLSWSDVDSCKYTLAGIPQNCEVVSAQVAKGRSKKEIERFFTSLKFSLEQIKPKVCLLYGGAKEKEQLLIHLPKTTEYVLLMSWRQEIKKHIQRGSNP